MLKSETLFLTFKKIMKYFKHQKSVENSVILEYPSFTAPNFNMNIFHICFRLKLKNYMFS